MQRPSAWQTRALLPAVLALLVSCSAGDLRRAASTSVRRYERWETSIESGAVPPGAAPRLGAKVMTPAGAVHRLRPFPDGGRWIFRYTPRELGAYRWEISLDGEPGGRLAFGAFEATPGPSRGFVRVDRRDRHRLVRDDGAVFRPLGENRMNVYDPAWNHEGQDIETYLATMAASGMNTLRVFVFTDCENEAAADHVQPGCLEPRVGEFDDVAASRFERIFRSAEQHGIGVILSLYALGFTRGETWKSWEDNPYALVNGGPAESPEDFFVSPGAREAAKGRLRYVLARWGSSPSLLAVDLLNEPEWDGNIGEETWLPWAVDLATTWAREDPYGHLVTLGSVGLHWNVDGDERPWYAHPSNDVVQWHLYGPEVYDPHALAAEMARKVAETWEYGKPVWCGEFAWGGEDATTYDHTHVGLWSATFAGAGVLAHSAPPFTLDSDEPMTPERARHFRVLADFLAALDARGPASPWPVRARTPGLLAASLGHDTVRALWLLAPKAGYGARVAGARLSVPALPPGDYVTEWRDDTTGEVLARTAFAHAGGDADLAAPAFSRHVAGLLAPR
jgi:hypothetical protein